MWSKCLSSELRDCWEVMAGVGLEERGKFREAGAPSSGEQGQHLTYLCPLPVSSFYFLILIEEQKSG